MIGFEVVFASKINFCVFGKQFTIYSRGFNQECGGVKTYGRLVQNSGNPKKQNHCLPPVKWTVRVRIIIWWYIHGVFLWSFLAHMTEYISPTRINLGFGWPLFGEPNTALRRIFRVSRQYGHGRHCEEGRGRHSGSDRWSFLGKAESTWWQTWYSDRS